MASQIPGTPEMMSIPGVGLVTVAGLLAEVGDLSGYDNPRQIQKLAGLNLRENSSGKHKGQTKISRRGRPRLEVTPVPSCHTTLGKERRVSGVAQILHSADTEPVEEDAVCDSTELSLDSSVVYTRT